MRGTEAVEVEKETRASGESAVKVAGEEGGSSVLPKVDVCVRWLALMGAVNCLGVKISGGERGGKGL